MQIIISSGHGKVIRGTSGYLDEVDEARRIVEKVADYLDDTGVGVDTFHDDVSTTQSENLSSLSSGALSSYLGAGLVTAARPRCSMRAAALWAPWCGNRRSGKRPRVRAGVQMIRYSEE